jgi:hypothetical protein
MHRGGVIIFPKARPNKQSRARRVYYAVQKFGGAVSSALAITKVPAGISNTHRRRSTLYRNATPTTSFRVLTFTVKNGGAKPEKTANMSELSHGGLHMHLPCPARMTWSASPSQGTLRSIGK